MSIETTKSLERDNLDTFQNRKIGKPNDLKEWEE
jgi:hypothetical protein